MDTTTTLLKHIHALSVDIGPRGPTTDEERKGHLYCIKVFQKLGLESCMETYSSARSIFHPHLIASAALLVSFLLYPLAGQASAQAAALLAMVALASDLLELSFRYNPIRLLVPKGLSQNAFAVLPPSEEHRQDLVLIGHVDTQRTPLIFRSKGWVTAYETFTTIAFIAFAAQVVLYFLGALTQWGWIWPASWVAALCAVLLAAICIQAESTPFNPGANDNASSVSMVLTLAEQIKSQPLEHTRVWLVCTGCEEVQHYGAADFFRRHQAELVNPKTIAFEMLGCAGPAWLLKEGIVIPFHSDPKMRSLAERLSAAHPEWKAYGAVINGGNTEMVDSLLAGIPAITITGLTPKGKAPYWHRKDDTFDKMDPEILCRAYDLTWTYIRALDKE